MSGTRVRGREGSPGITERGDIREEGKTEDNVVEKDGVWG